MMSGAHALPGIISPFSSKPNIFFVMLFLTTPTCDTAHHFPPGLPSMDSRSHLWNAPVWSEQGNHLGLWCPTRIFPNARMKADCCRFSQTKVQKSPKTLRCSPQTLDPIQIHGMGVEVTGGAHSTRATTRHLHIARALRARQLGRKEGCKGNPSVCRCQI
jgi:hypothetical protein